MTLVASNLGALWLSLHSISKLHVPTLSPNSMTRPAPCQAVLSARKEHYNDVCLLFSYGHYVDEPAHLHLMARISGLRLHLLYLLSTRLHDDSSNYVLEIKQVIISSDCLLLGHSTAIFSGTQAQRLAVTFGSNLSKNPMHPITKQGFHFFMGGNHLLLPLPPTQSRLSTLSTKATACNCHITNVSSMASHHLRSSSV